ncbi:cellulase family glycosylhydrolase [Xanthovirga aplysinae]|uniref:cellulase family glycosylhydrolase n=1 Tax=Xanthovirga aplysinae TaxID=2529853 RepID=UPI00165764E0|nr:cellulase family glycosylhydrolase [Xanthovirga aplysinae]
MKTYLLIILLALFGLSAPPLQAQQLDPVSPTSTDKGYPTLFIKVVVPEQSALYAKTTISAVLLANFNDPFDQFEIAMDLKITTPSGAQLLHPCYFERGLSIFSIWKTHWSPRESGEFKVQLILTQNGKQPKKSATYTVMVNQEGAENLDGFLSLADTSFWTFQFESGKKFRGIGLNLAWEPRPEIPSDIQQYTYDFLLPLYKEKGINFFRTWMCPWNLPLEWKITFGGRYPNDTTDTYNRFAIDRMDSLVTLLEENKLYLMLTLGNFSDLYTNSDEFGNPPFWPKNNYNVTLGGPATTPEEFFTLEAAKQQYKNRLRYIISRWGYSPYIPIIEFWNEIDNAINAENLNADSVVAWHQEMGAYWKTTDTAHSHILTTSISDSPVAGLFDVPDIQISQEHLYGATGTIHKVVNEYSEMFNKPFVAGEFSLNSQVGPTESTLPEYDADLRTGLWFGIFSPTPIYPMTWWWQEYTELDTIGSFEPAIQITEQMFTAGEGSFAGFVVTKDQNIDAFGVQTGDSFWVYLRNFQNNPLTVNANFPLNNTSSYKIRRYNTITQQYTDLTNLSPVNGVLFLPPLMIDAHTEVIILSQKISE